MAQHIENKQPNRARENKPSEQLQSQQSETDLSREQNAISPVVRLSEQASLGHSLSSLGEQSHTQVERDFAFSESARELYQAVHPQGLRKALTPIFGSALFFERLDIAALQQAMLHAQQASVSSRSPDSALSVLREYAQQYLGNDKTEYDAAIQIGSLANKRGREIPKLVERIFGRETLADLEKLYQSNRAPEKGPLQDAVIEHVFSAQKGLAPLRAEKLKVAFAMAVGHE